ncbi:hypothetical protein L3Q65_00070 (plasmid) [Amycolatopsis sp. FU40]|uniref:hypothetical protein n=1 Tax=Amycolatopsis sp. FU40 TaxID=2914159 RepID=UPI001F4339BA|nr:hypothetical protein [Amycolatopsis sp. FU40]UKD50755.1 hypothetical protein L3Q65_00070 [Amycolatopsis sp. FU40]
MIGLVLLLAAGALVLLVLVLGAVLALHVHRCEVRSRQVFTRLHPPGPFGPSAPVPELYTDPDGPHTDLRLPPFRAYHV